MTSERGFDGKLLADNIRLTPFGRWLRASSLDELPELLLVIRGHLSLIGPRPLPVMYLTRYSAHQARRHEVLPGLSGWAQVNRRTCKAGTIVLNLMCGMWITDRSGWMPRLFS